MNRFGRILNISVFGESHGACVGVVIDGCPPGIALQENDFYADIARRKSGKPGTTSRTESDIPVFESGIFNNFTTGAPLTILFRNTDIQPADYSHLAQHPRPGHADFTAHVKYGGYNDYRGGGHFSGRLTLALVAAGVVAKKILCDIQISARLTEAGGTPDVEQAVALAIEQNQTIGGIVTCEAHRIPAGWGEPFFDSLESCIAHLAFAVPAIKGIEFGMGFGVAKKTGIEVNDPILNETGQTLSNHSGGISGGIANGNPLVFRVAVRPASSISQPQQTFNFERKETAELTIGGRHDVCIALRVPVIMEAITAIALADSMLVRKNQETN